MIVAHLPFLGRLAAVLLTRNADDDVVAFGLPQTGHRHVEG